MKKGKDDKKPPTLVGFNMKNERCIFLKGFFNISERILIQRVRWSMDTMRENPRKRLSFLLSSFFLVVFVFLSACGGGGGGSSGGGGGGNTSGSSPISVSYCASGCTIKTPPIYNANQNNMAIDGQGNIWVTSENPLSHSTDGLIEIIPNSSQSPISYCSSGCNVSLTIDTPTSLAVDLYDNIFVQSIDPNQINGSCSNCEYKIFKIPSKNPSSYTTYCFSGCNINNNLFGFVVGTGDMISGTDIAGDVYGNVWLADGDNCGGCGTVGELGPSPTLSVGNYCNSGCTNNSGYNFSNPIDLATDSAGNIWVSNFNANSVTKIPGTNTLSPIIFSATTLKLKGPGSIVADGSGNIWVASQGSGGTGSGILTEIPSNNPSNAVTYCASGCTHNVSLTDPGPLAVDGSGNIWVVSSGFLIMINPNNYSQTSYCGYSIICNGVVPFLNNFIGISALAVDGSGNIWVTGNISTNNNGNNVAVLKITSIASPTRTPLPSALLNGFKP